MAGLRTEYGSKITCEEEKGKKYYPNKQDHLNCHGRNNINNTTLISLHMKMKFRRSYPNYNNYHQFSRQSSLFMSSVNYVHVIGQVAHKYHSSSVNSQNKVPCVNWHRKWQT